MGLDGFVVNFVWWQSELIRLYTSDTNGTAEMKQPVLLFTLCIYTHIVYPFLNIGCRKKKKNEQENASVADAFRLTQK